MSVTDPHHLAALHAGSFGAPWDVAAFRSLLDQPGVVALAEPEGFILIRVVADEAEILTLAVNPDARRRGIGRDLVDRAVADARAQGARRLFLEVADDNAAALALYARRGFENVGTRPRYYARADGSQVDARVLALNLPDPLP